jgi:hypothetical protein
MRTIGVFGTVVITSLLIILFGCVIAYIYETFKLMRSKNNVLSEEEV